MGLPALIGTVEYASIDKGASVMDFHEIERGGVGEDALALERILYCSPLVKVMTPSLFLFSVKESFAALFVFFRNLGIVLALLRFDLIS